MTSMLYFALVLSTTANLSVVSVYPTAENCEIMQTRVRAAVADPRIAVTCEPTTFDRATEAERQLRDLRSITSPNQSI